MKHIILFLVLSFSAVGYVHAQNEEKVVDFASVEVLPEFPGGWQTALGRYIQHNYKYSAQAREIGVNGKVILSFIVEKDGSLTAIKIIRELGFGTGEEAVRVLKASPKWNPGMQNGKPVRVACTLPFKLDLGAE